MRGTVQARWQKGFTLIELIAVMVIIAVITVTATIRLMPSSLFELQAARDQLVTALFYAQQKALYSPLAVRVITLGRSVDVRVDADADGVFSAAESIQFGAVQYPLDFAGGVSVSSHTLNYSALGEVPAASLTLTRGSKTVAVTVSESGYAQ